MIKGASSSATAATTAAMRPGPVNISVFSESESTIVLTHHIMYWGYSSLPLGVVVKYRLGVGAGEALMVNATGMIVSVSVVECTIDIVLVVGCVVAVMSLECCGIGLGVLWTSTVCCLLVSVLVTGSPLTVSCSVEVVDIRRVCCCVVSVLVVTRPVYIVVV